MQKRIQQPQNRGDNMSVHVFWIGIGILSPGPGVRAKRMATSMFCYVLLSFGSSTRELPSTSTCTSTGENTDKCAGRDTHIFPFWLQFEGALKTYILIITEYSISTLLLFSFSFFVQAHGQHVLKLKARVKP